MHMDLSQQANLFYFLPGVFQHHHQNHCTLFIANLQIAQNQNQKYKI